MRSESIEILFNGQARETSSETVAELLHEFELAGRKVAVELNRKIVQRDDYDSVSLTGGDSVEIVQFVGGG